MVCPITYHWVSIPPMACIISAAIPDKPGVLCVFIFFNGTTTSLIFRLMQSAGPSLTSADIPWSHSFLFIHQFFHVLLPRIFNPFLIYNHLTWYSFRQFDAVISHLHRLSHMLTFFLPSALPFEKFQFGAQDYLNHLRIPSVSFPLPRK